MLVHLEHVDNLAAPEMIHNSTGFDLVPEVPELEVPVLEVLGPGVLELEVPQPGVPVVVVE